MWLLLPESARQEITDARRQLNLAASVVVWGLLFCLWAIWTWWALLVGVAVSALAYYIWVLSSAQLYGDLLESAFDLYRKCLYDALRWPIPKNPAEELKLGSALTEYLWRGSDADFVWEPPQGSQLPQLTVSPDGQTDGRAEGLPEGAIDRHARD
jgi:hypothetical protein